MSEVITFNTETAVKEGSYVQSIDVFSLVDENDPILKTRTTDFDFSNPDVDPMEFSSQLVETCRLKGGFGLAAPQVGMSVRVFVMGSGEEYVAMFNPKIVNVATDSVEGEEGCLSYPNLWLKVKRQSKVTAEYFDRNGNKCIIELAGMDARCFLHELDHLNGKTFDKSSSALSLKLARARQQKKLRKLKR